MMKMRMIGPVCIRTLHSNIAESRLAVNHKIFHSVTSCLCESWWLDDVKYQLAGTNPPSRNYNSCASLGCCKLFLKFLDFLCRLSLSFPLSGCIKWQNTWRAQKLEGGMSYNRESPHHIDGYLWLPYATAPPNELFAGACEASYLSFSWCISFVAPACWMSVR